MIEFQRWVRGEREATGLTQRQFAELIGVSASTLLNWERGKRRPRSESYERLSEFFDVDRSDLETMVQPEPITQPERLPPVVENVGNCKKCERARECHRLTNRYGLPALCEYVTEDDLVAAECAAKMALLLSRYE